MSIFKRTQRKYVKKAYRVRNWREYEAGLRNRGSLTVWISLTAGKLGCLSSLVLLSYRDTLHDVASDVLSTPVIDLCGPRGWSVRPDTARPPGARSGCISVISITRTHRREISRLCSAKSRSRR